MSRGGSMVVGLSDGCIVRARLEIRDPERTSLADAVSRISKNQNHPYPQRMGQANKQQFRPRRQAPDPSLGSLTGPTVMGSGSFSNHKRASEKKNGVPSFRACFSFRGRARACQKACRGLCMFSGTLFFQIAQQSQNACGCDAGLIFRLGQRERSEL